MQYRKNIGTFIISFFSNNNITMIVLLTFSEVLMSQLSYWIMIHLSEFFHFNIVKAKDWRKLEREDEHVNDVKCAKKHVFDSVILIFMFIWKKLGKT